jgi:hypothetical protein
MFVLTDSPIPIDIIDDSITRIFDTSNGSTMIVDGDVTRTLLIEATAATVGLGTVRGTIVFSMAAATEPPFRRSELYTFERDCTVRSIFSSTELLKG